VGQSTARNPGTNSSTAAKTNTPLFPWYRGTDRAEGRGGMKWEQRVKDGGEK